MSAMKVCLSGTRLCSRASSRTSSSPGVRSRSTATLIEHPVGVGELEPALGHQHGEVVEDVGGLLGHSFVRLVAGGARDLLGLLLDLRTQALWIREQLRRVALAGPGRAALGDRPLERRQRLVRGGREVAVVEAGALARVAGRPGGLDEHEDRVLVAVEADLLDALDVARRGALVPQLLARARPEPRLAGLARAPERLVVHVGEREDLAGAGVLDDARKQLHGTDYGLARAAAMPG